MVMILHPCDPSKKTSSNAAPSVVIVRSAASPIIGLPFLAIVNEFESNVLCESKILTLSPLTGDPGRVTVNEPPDVLAKHCCLLARVTPDDEVTLA